MARGRKKKVEEATQAEAEKMIESGEAEIPAEAVVPPQEEKPKSAYQDHMGKWESKAEKAEAKKSSESDLDYSKHPKFHKFKGKSKGAK